MTRKFSFFNSLLEHSHDVTLSSVIGGVDFIRLVSEGKNCNFTMVSWIKDMEKIKSCGVENQYTGDGDRDYLMSGMKVEATEDAAKPTISVSSFKDCALILNKVSYARSLLDLGDDRLLLRNLLISSWQVVAVIQTDLSI